MNTDITTGYSKIRGDIMIELVELGEGKVGGYNQDDPDDVELLRFDVSYRDANDTLGWAAFDDASYCTQLPASATEDQRTKALELLMGHIYEPAMSGNSIKKLCEFLSWISPESLETGIIEQKYVLSK
jgi:hypothetical protein